MMHVSVNSIIMDSQMIQITGADSGLLPDSIRSQAITWIKADLSLKDHQVIYHSEKLSVNMCLWFEFLCKRIYVDLSRLDCVNILRAKQNGCHFAYDLSKCIFLNENVLISYKISLKFLPKGPINKIPALVQIMDWRRLGNKPLSEPMMALLTDTYMRHSASMS